MKPILFAANATNFTTNGLGQLDPTSCVVTEERNGQYELICVVPVDSVHYSDIENNMILAVVPGDGMNIQAFRIYQITEPMNGLVVIAARHISYDLSYNTVMPFEAASCTAALSGLESHVVENNLFDTWTDKSVVQNFKVSTPQTFRACLGGQRGSILDVYGGEYEWDNFTVKLYVNRGQSTNVTLRYGKNITDISQEQNLENVVTGIVPFWASEDTVVTLPEKSVDSAYASQYPYKRTVPIDFSNEWEGAPTESQLRARAQSYITANNIGVPKVSIKVSFVALWQTEEYKNIAPLERVHLCDTVGVVFDKYGIDARAKVIKTEWDCLAERYLSIELGEARSNLASTLVSMNEETTQEVIDTKSELQQAIDRATNTITGANGGWVKLQTDADGKPTEILIMDTDDIDTAQKIWRWNLGGLGYSKDGYEGSYGTAMTMNGEIVANFITTGEMSANRVRAGLLVSTAKQTGTQIPVTTINLDTGKLSTVDGEFKGTINAATITGGSISGATISGNTITGGTISGATITSQASSGGTTYTTTISGGKITTNNITATGGTFSNVTISGYAKSSDLNSYATKAGLSAGTTTINGGCIQTSTLSCNTLSGGTITGQSINGGTITGASISGGTLTSGTTSASKIVIQDGEIKGYYNNSAVGKINMVSGGIRLGESGSIFDSYIDIIEGNYIEIGANVLKINGATGYSGQFRDYGHHLITVTNGIITNREA